LSSEVQKFDGGSIEEETPDRGGAGVRASWGAAVLRPYMIANIVTALRVEGFMRMTRVAIV
jgi:hypothetical protein